MEFNSYAKQIRDNVYQDTVIKVKRVDLRNAWPIASDDKKKINKREVRISYKMSLTIEDDLKEAGIGIAFRFKTLRKRGQEFFVLYDQRSLSRPDSLPPQAMPFLKRLAEDSRLYDDMGIGGLQVRLKVLNNFVKEFGDGSYWSRSRLKTQHRQHRQRRNAGYGEQ